MTKTGFITVEIPVSYERGPDGWYAWARLDIFGGDAATPERALKMLEEKIREGTKRSRKRVRRQEAAQP